MNVGSNGHVNTQNCRIWGSEPPHELLQIGLHPQKIGGWTALSRQRVIGPIFFEGNLNAEWYRDEILFDFIDQLDEKEMEHLLILLMTQ